MKVWQTIYDEFDLYVSEFKLGAPGYIHNKEMKKWYLAEVVYVRKRGEKIYRTPHKEFDYRGCFHFGEDYRVGLKIVTPLKKKDIDIELSGWCC